MAFTEKFIEGIVHNASQTYPNNARLLCVFFGFSEPFQRDHMRIEKQAAVVCYRLGMVATYKLYTSDTGETTGFFVSQATVPVDPEPSFDSRISGCITTEYATIGRDQTISVSLQGEELRYDERYRQQLGSRLALLTLEC